MPWSSPHYEKIMVVQTDYLRLYALAYSLLRRKEYLEAARSAHGYLTNHLMSPEGVYYTSQDADLSAQVDGRTYYAKKNAERRELASHAMRYLASPAIAEQRRLLAGILLVDQELANDPVHVTVVGGKDDAAARELFAAANRFPVSYKRIEWWDRREGRLPNPDVRYPQLARAAAFACATRRAHYRSSNRRELRMPSTGLKA